MGIYGLVLSESLPKEEFCLACYEAYDEMLMADLRADLDSVEAACVWIEGYFQNEGCFASVADELKERVSLPAVLPDVTTGRTPVAVHVRIAGRLHSAAHVVCSPKYFAIAMSAMRDRIANPVFLIFSDDMEGCRNYVEDGDDVIFMPAANELETQALMQHCNAFILANSAFSWWPAWLSGSTNVICPSQFFKDRKCNIFPDRWLRISPVG